MSLIKLSQCLHHVQLEIDKIGDNELSTTEIDDLIATLEKKQKTINNEFQSAVQHLNDLKFENAVSGEINTYEIYTDRKSVV